VFRSKEIKTYCYEHGSNSVAKDFTKGNGKLIERDHVTTKTTFDGFGDVNRNGTTLKTYTNTQNQAGSDDHCIVHCTSFESTTDGVEYTREDNSPATSEIFVSRRENNGTSHSPKRHSGVDQTVLAIVEAEILGKEEVGTGDERLI
jgi:hypothetical protein